MLFQSRGSVPGVISGLSVRFAFSSSASHRTPSPTVQRSFSVHLSWKNVSHVLMG